MQDKTKSRVLTAVSMVALAVVVVSPAAASWHGLERVSRFIGRA